MADLKATDQFLKDKVQELKDQKKHDEMVGLIALLGENLTEDIKKAISEVKIEAPTIPEIKTPELPPFPAFPAFPEYPAFPEVKLPTINVPTPQVTVNVPEVKLPTINVPEPKVTVNVEKPDAPIVNIPPFPVTMEVTGNVGLKDVSKKTPLPVLMMDGAGNPMMFPVSGGGGGRGDFFTIKDIQNSTGGSLIDVDGNLKVSGNFSVTSSVTSTIAQIGNSDGDFSASNPLQIAGTLSTTPGATFYASDAVGSVNVIQSVPIDTRQVSGVSFSTDVLSMPAVVVTSITNSVASALVDSSGVAYSGSNPLPITGSLSTTPGATFYASDAVGSMNLVQVGGNAVVVGTGYQDNALRVVQATDAISSTNIAEIGGTTAFPLEGNTFADTKIGFMAFARDSGSGAGSTVRGLLVNTGDSAGALRVVHASDASTSVNVTNASISVTGTVAVSGVTGSIGATILNGEGVARDTWGSSQVGTWNITTLTGVTNSVASSLVDSSGIQYSGSNPLPTKELRSATGTNSSVADNAASVTILASNTARLGATVYNDSSAILYLLLGSTAASTTNYTCKIASSGYYEVPFGYTGQLTGIWATDPGDGAARVTEIT